MTPAEEFESLLKEVVNAKRLSASKMTSLTDLVMKNVEHDTQLVSVLYRTHKSLSSTTAKIWSLYVFDALSRAAKSYVVKHNVSGDISTQPGNPATFLLKIGGILEGLFQDMIASGNSGSKEKTKKIYDIWVKGNTFPPAVLSQLADVLKRVDEVPKLNSPPATLNTDTPLTSMVVQVPVLPVVDPQAALLALLTQAAASSSVTVPPQTTASGNQLDAAQLAVLRQLAHTAASVPSVAQSLPIADPVNVQKFPTSGINGSSRPMPEVRAIDTNEQRHSGYRSSEHESRTTFHSDNRDSIRGRYRAGNFRGRGRGDRFGRNWDGDDYRHLDRNSRSPRSSRGGRDRSKSPRNGDKWGPRFTSPPRRLRDPSPPSNRTRDLSVGRENEPDKDEFGRDIRPESPAHTRSLAHPPISPPSILDPRKSPIDASNAPHSTLDENPVTVLSSNKLPSTASATLDSDSNISELGLESFDPATFDYTSPTSWNALGNMWQVTNGCLPSQEQLVQFVVSYGTGQQMASTFQPSNQSSNQNFASSRGRGQARGYSRGRGGSSYGNGRAAIDGWGKEDDSQTYAVVLGGGEGAADDEGTVSSDHGTSEPSAQQNQGSVANAGCMQRVGDGWVYVRGVTADQNIS